MTYSSCYLDTAMKAADEAASTPYDIIIGVYAGDRTQESSLWTTTLLAAWDVYVSVYEAVLAAQFGFHLDYLPDLVKKPDRTPSLEYPRYVVSGCAVKLLYSKVGICRIDTSSNVSSFEAYDAACADAVRAAQGQGSPDSKIRIQVLERAFGRFPTYREGVCLYGV